MTASFAPNDLLTPAVAADPYPAYRQLREQSPVSYGNLPGAAINAAGILDRRWGFMKYADVYNALRDHQTFSSETAATGQFGQKMVLLQDDPPRHSRLRRLVNSAFTLKRVEALEPWIASIVHSLLDELLDDSGEREVDFVAQYSVPLPVRVIARLLGIPGEQYETFKRWSDAFISATAMSATERMQHVQAMVAYFGQMAAERRAHGAEDLITALVEGQIEGEALEEWEILGFCILLLIAGNETTTNLLGNMLNILAERPDLWRQLKSDPSLVEPFIEETLRFESPVQRLFRIATREVEVSGKQIGKGDLVTIFYGAANRDPEAFPEPDTFRLDRDLRNHVAFGTGIHYCLGAPLARAEAKISLTACLDRLSHIERGAAPAVRQNTSYIVLGFKQLPLRLIPQ